MCFCVTLVLMCCLFGGFVEVMVVEVVLRECGFSSICVFVGV